MKISKSRLQFLVLIPLLAFLAFRGFVYASEKTEQTLHYTAVQGTIVGNAELCRVYGAIPEAQAEIDRNTLWGRGVWGDCEAARAYTNDRSTRYHAMNLVEYTQSDVVSVKYVAPSDGSVRLAQLNKSAVAPRGGKDESIGTTLTILAHKTDPELVSWP